eukprot:COSAG02_NODE_1541_length_12013_cov_16.409182_2_plen_128_part_00
MKLDLCARKWIACAAIGRKGRRIGLRENEPCEKCTVNCRCNLSRSIFKLQYLHPRYPLPQHCPCRRPISVGALATMSATVSGLVSPRVSGKMHIPITPATTAVVPNINSGTSAANAGGTCSTSIHAQ